MGCHRRYGQLGHGDTQTRSVSHSHAGARARMRSAPLCRVAALRAQLALRCAALVTEPIQPCLRRQSRAQSLARKRQRCRCTPFPIRALQGRDTTEIIACGKSAPEPCRMRSCASAVRCAAAPLYCVATRCTVIPVRPPRRRPARTQPNATLVGVATDRWQAGTARCASHTWARCSRSAATTSVSSG